MSHTPAYAPAHTPAHTPAYMEKLNSFIANEAKNLASLHGSNSFGNFPVYVGTHYEFCTAIYVQRKAELIITSPARGDVITDSALVKNFMNRKVLTDLGRFSSSLVYLLCFLEIREFMQEHEFHKRDPNSTFCADLMEAFEEATPTVQALIKQKCDSLDSIESWFYILPRRQQIQCLLKALAGIMWIQAHSILSSPCTQAQVERTVIIGRFLSNTAGLEPATYVEWLKG